MFRQAIIEVLFNSKNAESQIDNFRNKVVSMGTAIAGAFGVKEILGQTTAIAEFAEKFNLPTEKASQFANAIAILGGSSEDAIGGLSTLQKAITDLRYGGGGALKEVAGKIGLSLTDSNGKMKNSVQLLEQLRVKFQGLNESAQIKIAEDLGLDSPALLRYLRLSQDEIKKVNAEAINMGVLDEESGKDIIELNQSLSQLRQSFVALAQELLTKARPAIEMIIEFFRGVATSSDETKLAILALFGVIGSSAVISTFGLVLKGLIGTLGVFTTVLKGVTLLFSPIALKIGLVIGAIAGLSYIIIEVTGGWDNFKEKALNAVEVVSNGFKMLLESAKEFISPITEMLANIIPDKVFETFNNLGESISNIFGGVFDKLDSIASNFDFNIFGDDKEDTKESINNTFVENVPLATMPLPGSSENQSTQITDTTSNQKNVTINNYFTINTNSNINERKLAKELNIVQNNTMRGTL